MSVSTSDAWVAMGDPTRRAILDRLTTQPQSVTELALDFPISRPAVSQHLRVLRDADLVRLTPRGRQNIYEVRSETLDALKSELEAFWRQSLATFKQIAEEEVQDPEE